MKKTCLLMPFICLILILYPLVTFAATYYVDRSRPDDSGAGTSWATAKRTIAGGVGRLSSGDTLLIASGTYSEAMVIDGKSFASETFIKTDDKSGNPGIVTITGKVSKTIAGSVTVNMAVYARNNKNLTIDGRQSKMAGDASYGFILNPSGGGMGIIADEYSTGGNIKILNVEVSEVKQLAQMLRQ